MFAGYGPFTKASKQWQALCAHGNGGVRSFKDGQGATLFDATVTQTLAKNGRTDEFRDKVAALFRAFLDPPANVK